MPSYMYTARDAAGKSLRGTVSGRTRHEALASLHAEGHTVVTLEGVVDDAGGKGAAAPPRLARGHFGLGRINITEKAVFCRQLSISVSSGIPLREALESIMEDLDNPTFKKLLKRVIERLDRGDTFSQAITGLEQGFDRMFVALIRAAEESGGMPKTLDYLSGSLEKSDRLVRRIRSVTAYPMFVGGFFLVAASIMTIFVLPRFQQVFAGFNAKLPLLTRVVLGVNAFILQNILYFFAAMASFIALFIVYGRSPAGRLRIDGWKLRVPFFGQCIRKLAVSRFCRNLGMMVVGGVPVAAALDVTVDLLGNKVLEASLQASRAKIMSGVSIAQSLDRNVFPRLVVRMVGVGESAGRLPEVLEKVSDVYDDQVEGSILLAMSLLEPVVICVFGVVILVLVLAIYMPVFTVAGNVR